MGRAARPVWAGLYNFGKPSGRARPRSYSAGPVSIRPVKLAGSLTCNALWSASFPFAADQPFCLPCRCKLSNTIPRPHLHFPCGWINYIQHADCTIVFWFVSAVCLETGSGRAGPVRASPGFSVIGPGRACIFLQFTRSGQTFFGPGRAGPGLIFSARAGL